MRMVRLYASAIVIAFWSILLFVIPFGHELRAAAWLSIAVALKIQIDESRREYRDKRDRR